MSWTDWHAIWDMESLEMKIGWGKYKSLLLREVVVQDPEYVLWAVQNTNVSISDCLNRFLGRVVFQENMMIRTNMYNTYYDFFLMKEKHIKEIEKAARDTALERERKEAEEQKHLMEEEIRKKEKNQRLFIKLEEQLKDTNGLIGKIQANKFVWNKQEGFRDSGKKSEKYRCVYEDAEITLIKESFRGKEYEWRTLYSFRIDIGSLHNEFRAPSAKEVWKYLEKIEKDKTKIEVKSVEEKAFARKEIEFVDMVVKCQTISCDNNHEIEDVTAVFTIIRNGVIRHVEVPAGYCKECDCYFILESTYKSVKQKGRLLCQVVTEAGFRRIKRGNANFSDTWAEESPLKIAGYNVDARQNLSAFERQLILEYIVDSGILTKNRIIIYLDGFISTRMSLSNMQNAISKWKEDRDYIANYKLGSSRHINVGKVTEKVWHKWYV